MTRQYAKPGDMIICPLVSKPVVIKTIYVCDYYGPAKADGWQIEFEDTSGEYRAWKQRCDGGELHMLGTAGNPFKNYLTRKELLQKISEANAAEDSDEMYYWNDILDDLEAAAFDAPDREAWVVTLCDCCDNYVPLLFEELLGSGSWTCTHCDEKIADWLESGSPENEPDPDRNYNAEVARHDKYTPCDDGDCPYGAEGGYACRDYCGLGVDEDDDYEEAWDDEEESDFYNDDEPDYSGNRHCDNTGVCCGDGCDIYYECQVHHEDK